MQRNTIAWVRRGKERSIMCAINNSVQLKLAIKDLLYFTSFSLTRFFSTSMCNTLLPSCTLICCCCWDSASKNVSNFLLLFRDFHLLFCNLISLSLSLLLPTYFSCTSPCSDFLNMCLFNWFSFFKKKINLYKFIFKLTI